MGYWFAAYVPAKTSPEVVKQLHDLLVAAEKRKSAQVFYESRGTTPAASSPEELGRFQLEESRKSGSIIKAANIEPE